MKMELILILIIIFLPLLANAKINSSYKKYSKVKNSMGLTGNDVARKILDKHGLNNIDIIFSSSLCFFVLLLLMLVLEWSLLQ